MSEVQTMSLFGEEKGCPEGWREFTERYGNVVYYDPKYFEVDSSYLHFIGEESEYSDVPQPIGITNMADMFNNCEALELDLSNWDTSKVTDMSRMFCECYSLEELNISNWDTSKVTDMQVMFSHCHHLDKLDLSEWDVSKVTNIWRMFSSCRFLKELDLSDWDTSKVTDMHNVFSGCESLKELNLGNWNVSKVTDMQHIFDDCPFGDTEKAERILSKVNTHHSS